MAFVRIYAACYGGMNKGEKMKAIWIFLLCLPAMFFMSCDEGSYKFASSKIIIENKSSRDLYVRFSPEEIRISKNTRIYGYKAVAVEKGESVSFIVMCESYIPPKAFSTPYYNNPRPNDNLKKIIFSKMDNKKLINIRRAELCGIPNPAI